ncbi:hypothetical protein BC830DRAFT_1064253 [Chytriomyces sp. MP71]|nr:hypothetical protein BC830DRAFT_1064253 [Chytriomyces sp. MP71]
MFADMITRVPNLYNTIKKLAAERPPLRVATMCSGTESPLLAIKLISEALTTKLGIPNALTVDHVFSCEIEPFKQAYIDRNFSPPILFRDVRELAGAEATNAYGAVVPVPGNVDVLIAGTSCVDYSSLNNKKQGIDAGGESGDTFKGMLGWVSNHRPPIVILENVCGAPWDTVVEKFDGVGYDAAFIRADTKHYYIPHTRTRVYLVAMNRDEACGYDEDAAEEWIRVFKGISRKASTPLEDYLLATDDPRIHRARQELAKVKVNCSDNVGAKSGRTDWSRCESRHAFARLNEELGNKRPLTAWSEGGMSNYPDFAWNDWGRTQTDRVLDLSDINYLRLARTGVDATHKTLVWNLSQNVDRNTASSHPGICPCLTPTMIAYITNRGGPLVGLEALSLQGIPVDELLLTRETEDQLADLAGNAMTSTVVGAAFLAAIVVGSSGLLARKETTSAGVSHSELRAAAKMGETMSSLDIRVVGTDILDTQQLNLSIRKVSSMKEIMDAADHSSRHCVCEGRDGVSSSAIQTCIECAHASCLKCGGRPEHVYNTVNLIQSTNRVEPFAFASLLKSALPVRLFMSWISGQDLLDLAKARLSCMTMDQQVLKSWCDIVTNALYAGAHQMTEFRFSSLKRQEVWSVVYASDKARLLLSLDRKEPGWLLYVNVPKGTPLAVREIFERPVCRLQITYAVSKTVEEGFLNGSWELFAPIVYKFKVTMKGEGGLIDSWEARIGLEGKFKDIQVWSRWRVACDESERSFGRLNGVYRAIPKCGTSMDSLHKKDQSEDVVFFFMDPTRCGNSSEDSFVFASHARRLEFKEQRLPVAILDPSWRPSSVEGEQKVEAFVQGVWIALPQSCRLTIRDAASMEAESATLGTLSKASFSTFIENATESEGLCTSSLAMVTVQVNLGAFVEDVWGREDWNDVNLVKHGRAVFEKVAWFTQRVEMPSWLNEWTFVDAESLSLTQLSHGATPCERCAPAEPSILWIPNSKGNSKSFVAIEDPSQAGVYENALKNRPPAFIVQLKRLASQTGDFRIGLNFASLIHRAAARLINVPFSLDCSPTFQFSWRLTWSHHLASKSVVFPRLELCSNRNDLEFSQPPHFKKFPLRPEQLRSLGWMVKQEREPQVFVEEEISEASLDFVGWRAEGRASRSVAIRGGVVADQVGYGKTAITLGLIDVMNSQFSQPAATDEPPDVFGKISVKATLVLVPGHLLLQWPSEVEKFLGDTLKTVVIADVGSLNKLTIRDIMKADIIVASSNIFNSDKYWQNFEVFSANGKLPPDAKKGGRYFKARYKDSLATLNIQIERLKAQEMADLVKAMETAMDNAASKEAESKAAALFQIKRLKGKQYREKGKTSARDSDEDNGEHEKRALPVKTKRHKLGSTLTDPWGLSKSDVKKSWKAMKSILFEMFAWNRVVVDEFTYLANRVHSAVINMTAINKWVLSGTPPVKDFNDVKSISVFLGINLGVDDESDFAGIKAKSRKKEATAVEQFHAFKEIHTTEWHARRHKVAQNFLNQLVRQNVAEIDEILFEEMLVHVNLPPAERAIYLELEHHLQALDMNSKKAIKFKTGMEGDRDRRMVKALGGSATAEEALMKRCSHFALDEGNTFVPAETCAEIVITRKSQLLECLRDIWVQLHKIDKARTAARTRSDYKEHCKSIRVKGSSDSPARKVSTTGKEKGAKQGAALSSDDETQSANQYEIDLAKVSVMSGKSKMDLDEVLHFIRELTIIVERLQKELVGRMRSLRFFIAVDSVVLSGQRFNVLESAIKDCSSQSCSTKLPSGDIRPFLVQNAAVLSCCGHMGCIACVTLSAVNQRCLKSGCNIVVHDKAIVPTSIFGDLATSYDASESTASGKFGAKLMSLVSILQERVIPQKEKALIFVQFDDLMEKVCAALDSVRIGHVEIKGTSSAKSKSLDFFQHGSKGEKSPPVLLLNVGDESAAGANLTCANHIFFVNPLFHQSNEWIQACETQAIGRCRRYGQNKKVWIYRLLAIDTIDTVLFEKRAKYVDAN